MRTSSTDSINRDTGYSDSLSLERRKEFEDSSDEAESEEVFEETPLLRSKSGPTYRSSSVIAQRVRLTWENLCVRLPPKKRHCFKRKASTGPQRSNILRNVSGAVESGQLIAIMGASGSGKTTLLNVLTARNIGDLQVEGSVRVNGRELGRNITAVSAYVQQDDLFVGTLTVREHLVFQALLRLPKRLTREQKLARVDDVMLELGLRKCSNTRIGIPGEQKGISGGESKRLAFASEVLRNPPILFCDEPTTGIDSFMAQSVLRVLQRLASGGKAILCTIHQPTSDVYKMFDRVIFLAEGRIAYAGSTSDALEFFANQGFRCPDDYNPSDHIIHTLAIAPGEEVECKERIEKICDAFASQNAINQDSDEAHDAFLLQADFASKSPYNSNWTVQFVMLLWRSLVFGFRHRNFVLAKVLQKTLLGLFIGLLYLDTKMDQKDIMNYNGALFFVLAEITFPAVFGLLTMIPNEFPLVVREHHNGIYKISSYYMATIVSLVPTFSVDAIIFICISYFMVGFRPTADGFFITLALSILIAQCSCAFALMLSALSPSFALALALAGPILTLLQMNGFLMASIMPTSTPLAVAIMTPIETSLMLMAGFFANVMTIPSYISWVQYISWFRYGYEGYAINQWHLVKNITCEPTAASCLKDGDEVLAMLSFNPTNLINDVLFMLAILVGFYLLGYLALWRRIYKSR